MQASIPVPGRLRGGKLQPTPVFSGENPMTEKLLAKARGVCVQSDPAEPLSAHTHTHTQAPPEQTDLPLFLFSFISPFQFSPTPLDLSRKSGKGQVNSYPELRCSYWSPSDCV